MWLSLRVADPLIPPQAPCTNAVAAISAVPSAGSRHEDNAGEHVAQSRQAAVARRPVSLALGSVHTVEGRTD
jgi:hypothetical protein